jgi:hypothetical protein
MLRRAWSAGIFATAGIGLAELVGAGGARAATPETNQLPATMILNALPTDAPTALIDAIEAGCCTTYTRDENHCGSGGCGTGWCCYHVVSTACDINEVICINVSCAEGNFTTGC